MVGGDEAVDGLVKIKWVPTKGTHITGPEQVAGSEQADTCLLRSCECKRENERGEYFLVQFSKRIDTFGAHSGVVCVVHGRPVWDDAFYMY